MRYKTHFILECVYLQLHVRASVVEGSAGCCHGAKQHMTDVDLDLREAIKDLRAEASGHHRRQVTIAELFLGAVFFVAVLSKKALLKLNAV